MEFFLLVLILTNLNFNKFGLRASEIASGNSQGSETIAKASLHNETLTTNFSTVLETTAKIFLTLKTSANFNSTANPNTTVDLAPKTPINTFHHTKETSKSTLPIPSTGGTPLGTPDAETPIIRPNSVSKTPTNASNNTTNTPNSTLSIPDTQIPDTPDTGTTPTKSILHQATPTGTNLTTHQPFTKNHTSPRNTTISKKKQKQPRNASIVQSTKPKNKSSRASFTYTAWTGTQTIPTTREIDYKESSEFIHESFKKFMLRTRVFVDKSLMIQEFLDHPKQVISITRPRFWGKSLNLNMLRKFFEIEVDSRGTPKPEQDRTNRKIFCGGQIVVNESTTKTLDALKIASNPKAMDFQGKYPVIQLNYAFICNGTYDEVISGMKYQIIRSFKKHFYLEAYFKSNLHFLNPNQQSTLERYSAGNLTIDDLTQSLRFLSELLYKYFNRQVFVLIDDYDTPLVETFRLTPDYSQNLDRVLRFYREFYSYGFKNSLYLAKALLTGRLRIANCNLFAYLDNIAEYTLLDHQFTQFYGFTEEEVDELLADASDIVSYNIKLFYKGLNYGDQIMYNPWCIKQCVENHYKMDYYWVRSGILMPGNKKMYSLEGLQQDIKSLLGGGSVLIPVKNEVTFEGLEDARNFFNFILFTGYLSPVAKYPNGTYELMKPNGELNLFYQLMLGYWMDEHDKKFGRFGITWSKLRNFTSTVLPNSSDSASFANSQKMTLLCETNETTSSTSTFHFTHSKSTSTSSTWFETNSTTTPVSSDAVVFVE